MTYETKKARLLVTELKHKMLERQELLNKELDEVALEIRKCDMILENIKD